MLIVDLNFTKWAELFRGHADMITAMSFNDNSVTVELNTKDYGWKTRRSTTGVELYYYDVTDKDLKVKSLGFIYRCDFGVLIVD